MDDQNAVLTAGVVSAYLSNNPLPAEHVAGLIANVSVAFKKLNGQSVAEPAPALKPAVSVKKSVEDDYIVCLEDGLKFKSLKRHLRARYGLTPEEYREKWNLPRDYPMVAPSYALQRSGLAKSMGLGRIGK